MSSIRTQKWSIAIDWLCLNHSANCCQLLPSSPEDHAILEAEYQRNPKPDKTARASIVSRVSLGEKEVQV